MMINYLESVGAGFEAKLAIAPRLPDGQSWFTVFIAENGGRKSFLLRCIVEAALGRSRYAPSKGKSIYLGPIKALPARVIAISGTPLDRFPRVGTRDLQSRRRQSHDDFVYLGPRASNGMSGIAQSERSFVGSLVSNRYRLLERITLWGRAFSHLGLSTDLEVTLAVAPVKGTSLTSQELEAIQLMRESSDLHNSKEGSELLEAIDELQGKPLQVLRTLHDMPGRGIRLKFGPDQSIQRRAGGLRFGMWELLLRLGRVTVHGTHFFYRKNKDRIAGEQLSSGQWGWLGTFGSLVAEIRDHSLIVVDEPENSLHPHWQQEFVRELHAIVATYSGCQVVVATHSPLIASGVSPDWGSIRTLTRPSRAGAFVRSKELPTAFGWAASDVYSGPFGLVSTRAPEFLEKANKALKRLSRGDTISPDQRQAWIEEFTASCQSLPPYDAMRDVLGNVIRRLQRKQPESEDGSKERR